MPSSDYVVPYGFDFGSYMTQAGNTDHYNSSADFRTIMGFPKEKPIMALLLDSERNYGSSRMKEGWIGDEVFWKSGIARLEYPIRRGIVKDWNLFELFLEFAFSNACRISSAEHPIIVTDSPFVRSKMTELMFERFNVPAFAMINCAMASCMHYGRTTGTIVTSGEGKTFVQSFYEGYLLKESIVKMEVGGWDITENLQRMLNQKGHSFKTSSDFEVVRLIKEKLSFLKMSEAEMMVEKEYELPDGNIINLGEELHECVEPLFNPHLAGLDCLGVHELVTKSIQDCTIDVRMDLYRNILPAGGNTMISNFTGRLKCEVEALAPPNAKVKVIDDASRKYSAWNGMATLSNMSSFQDKWYTKEYYEENGSSSLLRSCVNFSG
ncbi:hypothetical protein NAEGRDRAFT_88141 [Naegleria gruberi]|uniref:Actin n=1 Tax=Naegleria gruberi TaxID=5762 RepID=D2VCC5_NAEGR|nr:uncharacterized protein NAEGRDRAFT_88141 [Naegleria gruberi]EFC45629.1 hypothetical protein NAEGRDRAFT_88141 [Naegleria gruberi]|eukprot:XP_002678373.1 hypothetical protein NAEGRDRAFT_88141 [Naegleria gruberi strain NEG-M]